MTSALELGCRLAAGELDAVVVCEEALERARAATGVFITVSSERARREAAESARRLRAGAPRGPLDGVPIAWKDLLDLAGTPTTAASALRRDADAAVADAPVVARLAAAGMVCVGKTNLSELAYSGLGLNPHFGTPPNPRGSGRAPGGSSSGSAVAVAAGIVPCAIGTDTAGSIRIPAAFCGIVGFKPSSGEAHAGDERAARGRIDRTGLLPLARTLDSIGPLATSVADLVALDAALRGTEPPSSSAVAPLRLVVPEGELVEDVDPLVAARFAAAVAALASAGAVVERRPVAAIDEARALLSEHGALVSHEAWRVHAALLDGPDAARIDRRVLRRLREGRALEPAGYEALLRERPRVQAALAADLGGALAVLPTAPHVAPEIAPLEADDDHFMAVNARTLRTTLTTSYLDMPGVSLPIGPAEDGMPAGLLLTGPSGDDDRVLAGALGAEAALTPVARAR